MKEVGGLRNGGGAALDCCFFSPFFPCRDAIENLWLL
jgi:hypothetical protein